MTYSLRALVPLALAIALLAPAGPVAASRPVTVDSATGAAVVTAGREHAPTTHSTYYVRNLAKRSDTGTRTGDFAVVSTRGKRVAFAFGSFFSELWSCSVGKRKPGRRAAVMHDKFSSETFKLRVRGAWTKPRVSLIGEGWRKATVKERRALFGEKGQFPGNAMRWCA